MCGGDTVKAECAHLSVVSVVQAHRPGRVAFQPIGYECPVGLGYYELKVRVRRPQGAERLAVQMIGVVVTGGHNVDEVEALPGATTRSVMRMWGLSVAAYFLREGIGEVGIEEEEASLPFEEEAALAEPPEVQDAFVSGCILHILEEGIILEEGFDQGHRKGLCVLVNT